MLDRFSQGCICLGQHYMSWSACDPRHIMCHPIYIMSSNIYMLDDIYILNNIVYVMENMCIYIGYVDIYIGEHIYIGQPIIYVGYQCICIGYIYWTTRCVHYENVIQHIYMLPKIYTQYIYPTYIWTCTNGVYMLDNSYIYWVTLYIYWIIYVVQHIYMWPKIYIQYIYPTYMDVSEWSIYVGQQCIYIGYICCTTCDA